MISDEHLYLIQFIFKNKKNLNLNDHIRLPLLHVFLYNFFNSCEIFQINNDN